MLCSVFVFGVCCCGIFTLCMCMHKTILSYVMANDSKTIKGGGNRKVLPTLSFPWHSGENEREGETLRMIEGDHGSFNRSERP